MEQQENHKVHDQINIIVQAPIAVAFLDNQLRYVAHSAKWCTDYKLSKTDLRGLNHYDLFPEISDEWRAKHQRVLNGAEESRDEELFIREDGSEQWLKWSVKPWYYHDGKIAGIVMVTEDISSQVLIKKRDQLDFKILLDLCSHANIGTWQYNNVTRELYWSDATKELHEVSDDFIPNPTQAINFYRNGESRNKISEAFLNSISRNEPYDLELELVTAKGNCIWVRATGQSEFKDGLCITQYGTFENISDRKKKEHEVKVTSQKFQKLFFNSNLGVAILDTATLQFLNVNPTLEQITKLKNKELLATSFDKLIDETDFGEWFHHLEKVLNKKTDHIKQAITLRASNGATVYTQTICNVLHDEHGDPENLVIQILDITNERKVEKEKKLFLKEIMSKNERLLNFAYIVSHNLRSHSSNFKGLIDFYKESEELEIRSKIISMLDISSDNLNQTIEDLNQVVSVHSNKIELKNIALKDFVLHTLESVSLEVMKNEYDIEVDIKNDTKIVAFPAYLESILLNLITNSIRYRDPNKQLKIIISAKIRNESCTIMVSDNGIGIDLERNKDKIFGMYKTFHEHKDSNGLGLFMTKNQVEAMGGNISVQSKVGTGTKFTIEL
ncbi:PAS domain S-box-containing protein [Nonlabens xylanidelens]|uniref:histidine kinase n=1 Tax=Nonlabens xylanidelens TaxID=191564 RepID=A0A2S6IRJ7_9FLAO|nr:PAS domain S-box protein [Nonlabens xylanidelens]PPK96867.1 PAS domain S-box-containing protein [Nonlabens xylanidelens]PQJ13565.1 hypothetical protein BST94_14530 [Nonlabens xylanidelens]